MPPNDRVILDKILEQRKRDVAPNMPDSEYFEVFTAEQILKDLDLSYDEIQSGVVGDGGDGGIDSIYLFLNGELIQEDTDYTEFRRNVAIDLHLIQAKGTSGFSEDTLHKFISVTEDLLDLSKDVSSLASVYNKNLLDVIIKFRNAYEDLASRFPRLTVSYHYASKGDEVHPNVKRKVEKLELSVKRLFSAATFRFSFINARELNELARRSPRTTHSITLSENPISSTGEVGFICLVQLSEYFKFITTDEGNLKRNLFESNVRDYQGTVPVNEGIQETLKRTDPEEFWWLNNGITILAAKANLSGKLLTVEDPQIVNGLQTSTEIHNYFKSSNAQGEKRNVLVRVIVPTRAEARDRVIKATNSQTTIPDASLRATEKIHRDIEEFFRPHGMYYDRRKNFYKNEGKPIQKIISIPQLAQAVMSILLKRPNDARARPSSLLKHDSDYKEVFSLVHPIKMYFVCAVIMKRIEEFVKSELAALEPKDRNNLKFYLAMYIGFALSGSINVSVHVLEKIPLEKIDDHFLSQCLVRIKGIYVSLGGTDQVAKGIEFAKALKDSFTSKPDIFV